MAKATATFNSELARSHELQQAIDLVAAASIEERGAVFTRREVVEFILDLADYHQNGNLMETRLLEPACGQGDFLLVVLERLLASFIQYHGQVQQAHLALRDCIRAVELHVETFQAIKEQVQARLIAFGISEYAANTLIDSWFLNDDFLVCDLPDTFTHIVGNPPYVRQERIPALLLAHYRTRYKTIFDRADLYIPFIERSLQLLTPEGRLAFICADRWMKNRYGGPLRTLIVKHFHLEYYVDMAETDAFHIPVSAYPAIIVIAAGNASKAKTRVVHRPIVDSTSLPLLARRMRQSSTENEPDITEISHIAQSTGPWLLGTSQAELSILRHLERTFPLFEDTGCKVGIGVATGCDRIYIGQLDQLPVEPSRKLPLITAPDIRSGQITWSGTGIINPFTEDGKLVPLRDYPQLATYFMQHETQLRKRHVGKRANSWYRTIDRIYPALTSTPKLLLPDIKGEANVVFDAGHYYPHHNLYYVISTDWDLRALQAILRSAVAKLFIANYAVKMRGNYLRFQAQYLRRIHLPTWQTLPTEVRERLCQAALTSNWTTANEATFDAYQLCAADRACILETMTEQ